MPHVRDVPRAGEPVRRAQGRRRMRPFELPILRACRAEDDQANYVPFRALAQAAGSVLLCSGKTSSLEPESTRTRTEKAQRPQRGPALASPSTRGSSIPQIEVTPRARIAAHPIPFLVSWARWFFASRSRCAIPRTRDWPWPLIRVIWLVFRADHFAGKILNVLHSRHQRPFPASAQTSR